MNRQFPFFTFFFPGGEQSCAVKATKCADFSFPCFFAWFVDSYPYKFTMSGIRMLYTLSPRNVESFTSSGEILEGFSSLAVAASRLQVGELRMSFTIRRCCELRTVVSPV